MHNNNTAEETPQQQTTKGLILLIGAPGSGKSLLGQVLQICGKKVAFFSVGNQLREMGLVDEHGRADTVVERKEIMERMRQEARAMIEKEIERTESILVLECVKDIHDAFGLMELLRVHQKTVKLLQVLYLPSPCVGKALMRKAFVSHMAAMRRDAERKVGERQEKWELNARAILEFFTSMGVTTEVVALKSAVNLGYKSSRPSSLANLGYASDRPSGDWHSSLKLPKILSFTPLQPVVSDRLVIDRGIIDAALHEAEEMTGLRIFKDETKFIVPSTPIKSFNDAAWVTSSPGRYCISRKCDGTRHVLIIGQENSFMLNRAGSVYDYSISTSLPVNTVLDGELVWVGGKGFFIAFDTISAGVKHARAWQLPLLDRVALMEGVLSLEEADSCEELRKASAEEKKKGVLTVREAWVKAEEDWEVELAAKSGQELARQKKSKLKSSGRYIPPRFKDPTDINMMMDNNMSIADWEQTDEYRKWHLTAKNNYMSDRRHKEPAFRLLHKKQQAPESSTTAVKVVWKRHLEVSPATLEKLQTTDCPYPTDGFVFTPSEAPYALGMAELLKKWQPADKIAADIRPNDHRNITETAYPMQLVNGLVYECFPIEEYDFLQESVCCWIPSSIRWDKQFGNSRASIISLETTTTMNAEILSFEDLIGVAKVTAAVKIDTFDEKIIHPARTTDSILLYSSIMAAVAEGRVERAVDADTGLEIFNHLPHCGGTTTPVENMCRGLVWHEGKVVATPFVRFSNELLWPRDIETGRASFKVDGALAIAFLWNGEIHVTTRRRMDSQQAIWARDWLRTHVGSDAFEPGWTYLLEAVFKDNAVVVQYAFDAAVLLAAFAPDGTRLTHNGCTALARKMGVMLTPSIIMGELSELERMLIPPPPRNDDAPPPSYEGWIVTLQMDGSNTKRVIPAYKEASMAKDKLHPLAVWDRVRTGGMARDEMLRSSRLPAHHVVELTHILDALQDAYDKTVEKVIAGVVELTDEEEGLAAAVVLVVHNEAAEKEEGYPLLPPSSMHYSHWIGNKLRVLVMDCIKPDIGGRLQGYAPSTLCINTIAKGWSNGPRTGRLAARDEPLISVKLQEPSLLALVLEQLEEGESICKAVLVNKEWSRVMLSSPEIKRKMDEIREVQILRNTAWSDSVVGLHSSDSGDYYDDDRHHNRYDGGGYGSN